jgi:hypothetical protein
MFSALSRLWQRPFRGGRASRPPRRPRGGFRPRLEALEDRYVLSPLTVTSSADDVNQVGTLRYAVAHAQDGDVIDILGGREGAQHITLTHGELFLNNSVTIESAVPGQATIDGNNSSRVFEVARGASVNLDNLVIIKGNAKAHNSLGKTSLDGYGGGILNEGSLTIDHCWVGNNGSTSFGTKNNPLKAGGGIYNYHGGLVVMESSVDDNFAGAGGGIYNDRGTLSVTDSTMAGNSASGGGGAILNALGVVSVGEGSALFSNHARDGGAIFSDGGDVTVGYSDLERNTAVLYGGALMVIDGTMTLTHEGALGSTLQDNTAGKSGGGIYNQEGHLIVASSNLVHNSAQENGGGIASRGGKVDVFDSRLLRNTAGHFGGAIYDYSSIVTVSGSLLSLNQASKGGAIYNDHGSLYVAGNHFIGNLPDHIAGAFTGVGNIFITI